MLAGAGQNGYNTGEVAIFAKSGAGGVFSLKSGGGEFR